MLKRYIQVLEQREVKRLFHNPEVGGMILTWFTEPQVAPGDQANIEMVVITNDNGP